MPQDRLIFTSLQSVPSAREEALRLLRSFRPDMSQGWRLRVVKGGAVGGRNGIYPISHIFSAPSQSSH